MKLKRILSFVLAAALMLAVAPAVSLDVVASTEQATIDNTKWYLPGYNYGGYNDDGDPSTLGGCFLSGYRTVDQILEEGYFGKKNVYAAWSVLAPEDGNYSFRMLTRNGAKDGYKGSAILVNDEVFVRDFVKEGRGDSNDSTGNVFKDLTDGYYYYQEFSVPLEKGMNVIRFLPLAEDKTYGWADIYPMYADSRVTVIEATGTNVLTAYAQKAGGYANWAADGANSLGNVGAYTGPAVGTTIANLNADQLKKVPHFSFNVNVPADGYYDITYNYTTNDDWDNREWYVFAIVDGVPHVCGTNTTDLPDSNWGGSGNKLNASLYLTKGTHNLTFTTAFASSTSLPSWFNANSIVIYGGVTLTDYQAGDQYKAFNTTRIEAESNSTIVQNYDKNASGVGNMRHNNVDVNRPSSIQSFAAIQSENWLDKSQYAMVTYYVDVPKGGAGSYTLRTKYVVDTQGVHENYFLTVSVNDNDFSKSYYSVSDLASTATNRTSYSETIIHLEEGRNIIRTISCVKDTYPMVRWMDYDYIEIYGGPAKVTAPDASRDYLQSADSPYYRNFAATKYGKRIENDFYLIQYRGLSVSKPAGVTYESLISTNLQNMKSLGYVAYTVDVPADGYYDLSTYIDTGKVGTGYIVLIDFEEDGTWTAHKMKAADDPEPVPGKGPDWLYRAIYDNSQNLTCHLTKGTHTLVVSGMLGHTGYASTDGYSDWCNLGALMISGGITKSAVQIDPLDYVVKNNTKNHGLVPGSVYAIDSNNVVSGVPFGASVLELKSNFIHSENITVTGDKDGVVIPGTTLTYADGTVYTVELMAKGDLNGDNKIDIRDLKLANEHVIGSSELSAALQSVADIDNDGTVMASDINSYRAIVHGESFTDVVYQPSSIGADAILELCNPVGRLTKTKDAVYMEHSASNLTITGRLSGDVVLNLYVDKVENDPIGFFIEIDGEMSYVRLSEAYKDVSITIAEDLDPNNHVIKISKSTDAKNDGIYINSISYNGTLTKSEPAEHKIVFLGDSITAGCGVYKSSEENFSKYGITASYFSYANVASDILGADYYSVANGGWSLCNDGLRIYDIYDTVSMHSWTKLGDYDFSFKPEVVVINLGTNDRGNTDEADVKAEAKNIIDLVKANNANATIFWAYEMMQDDAANIAWIKTVCEENGVHYVALPENVGGWGAHPTVEGQKAAGEKLAEIIAQKMGW